MWRSWVIEIGELLRQKREDILRIAASHGTRNVRVFGSFAREEAQSDSDLDLLVEMGPDCSLLDHVARKAGLSVEQQYPLAVRDEHGTGLGEYFADLFAATCVIVELKACRALADEHIAQLLGYPGLPRSLSFSPSSSNHRKGSRYSGMSPCLPYGAMF